MGKLTVLFVLTLMTVMVHTKLKSNPNVNFTHRLPKLVERITH